MFYVPDDQSSPVNQKASFRIIKKFSQLFSKINPERKNNLSSKNRFKTVTMEVQAHKRNSLPCKFKRSNVNLPMIEEKKFLLRGSEFNPHHQKTESSRKVGNGFERKLKHFKIAQKSLYKDKIAHRMKQSFDNLGVFVQPWIVSQQFPSF